MMYLRIRVFINHRDKIADYRVDANTSFQLKKKKKKDKRASAPRKRKNITTLAINLLKITALRIKR